MGRYLYTIDFPSQVRGDTQQVWMGPHAWGVHKLKPLSSLNMLKGANLNTLEKKNRHGRDLHDKLVIPYIGGKYGRSLRRESGLIEFHDLLAGLQDHRPLLTTKDKQGVGLILQTVGGRVLAAVQSPHVHAAR